MTMPPDPTGPSRTGAGPAPGSIDCRNDRIIPGISARISALRQDLVLVTDYPVDALAAVIRNVGFACTCCTRCCTREFNDHVFLLDRDTAVIREVEPAALLPAPYFELCDQYGRFYDSGYALRTQQGGSCIFLDGKRCRIYEKRLSICRIYPYMLHREPDEAGFVDWRQISGLNRHGTYHNEIPVAESIGLAQETRGYEIAFLEQTIRFYEFMCRYFAQNRLRYIRKVYDDRMRAYKKGEEIGVFVLYNGRLEGWCMKGDEAVPDTINL
jgi:hypothetical protein